MAKAQSGAEVQAFFNGLGAAQRPIALALHEIVVGVAPECEQSIKWGHPTYTLNGNVCSIMPAREYVRLQLFRGVELDDPARRLEGSGRGMRHVKVRSVSELDAASLRDFVRQAVQLQRSGSRANRSGT